MSLIWYLLICVNFVPAEDAKSLRLSGERLHAEQCRHADLKVEQQQLALCTEPDPPKVSFLLKCVKRRIGSCNGFLETGSVKWVW